MNVKIAQGPIRMFANSCKHVRAGVRTPFSRNGKNLSKEQFIEIQSNEINSFDFEPFGQVFIKLPQIYTFITLFFKILSWKEDGEDFNSSVRTLFKH